VIHRVPVSLNGVAHLPLRSLVHAYIAGRDSVPKTKPRPRRCYLCKAWPETEEQIRSHHFVREEPPAPPSNVVRVCLQVAATAATAPGPKFLVERSPKSGEVSISEDLERFTFAPEDGVTEATFGMQVEFGNLYGRTDLLQFVDVDLLETA
jgi:hypothetical protein